MYLFITIILIAELIIAINIICLILKLDKKVIACDKKIYEFRPEICKKLHEFKDGVTTFVKNVHSMIEFGKIQRNKYIIKIVQNILVYLLLFLLKTRSKKSITAIKMAMNLSDLWGCKC